MPLKKDYLVQKRNILNELRANNMTLQELRFFSIYLAKINKNDVATRVVRFTLSDFQKIMEYGRLNIAQLKNTTDSLLCKVIHLPLESGGYTSFQLFKECTVSPDDRGEWYIEIEAHDKALPLMFEFKNRYFSYQLWNALRLRSPNQVRMYEILKQYETAGERIISVEELRELLGIDKNEYPQWERFRVRVLEACQTALAETTDIKFTYEPHGRRGPRGKILAIKFVIERNVDYIDQLTLEEFIVMQTDEEPEASWVEKRHNEIIELLSDACSHEFSQEQVQLLRDLVIQIVPVDITGIGTEHYDYLFRKYNELNYQDKNRKIKKRFEYFRVMLKAEVQA